MQVQSTELWNIVTNEAPSPTPVHPDSSKRRWLFPGITVVVLIMIIGFSMYVTKMMSTLEAQNRQLSALGGELIRKDAMLSILASSQLRITPLKGAAPEAYGNVLWDPERRTVLLQISHLPQSLHEQDYHLWAVMDGRQVSVGAFSVESNENHFYKFDVVPPGSGNTISDFSVTLEPRGVSQPTGAVYLAGSPRM